MRQLGLALLVGAAGCPKERTASDDTSLPECPPPDCDELGPPDADLSSPAALKGIWRTQRCNAEPGQPNDDAWLDIAIVPADAGNPFRAFGTLTYRFDPGSGLRTVVGLRTQDGSAGPEPVDGRVNAFTWVMYAANVTPMRVTGTLFEDNGLAMDVDLQVQYVDSSGVVQADDESGPLYSCDVLRLVD